MCVRWGNDSIGAIWTFVLSVARHTALTTRLALPLALVIGPPAAAAGLDQAEALYQQGDMAGAATLARSLKTASGFALAARATLVQAAYLSPDATKQALFEQAKTDARNALALDPDQVDAHLELAVALGQLAELEDPISAHVNGYAEDGKTLLDQALALDPDNAWAHALLGMWHLRVVHYAGDSLADSLYGASRTTGVALCSETMAGTDQALALKYGCARTLVELDPGAFAGTAAQILDALKQATPADAVDRLVQDEAAQFLAELKSADPE
jgi:hypothetical protein